MSRVRVSRALGLILVFACDESRQGNVVVAPSVGGSNSSTGGASGGGGPTGPFFPSEGGAGGVPPGPMVGRSVSALRIEPADAVLAVPVGETRDLAFKAFATLTGDPSTEVDLTDQSVFYVPDNFLVAQFPANGDAVLSTRRPIATGEPLQRGGALSVRAQIANADGSVVTATTQLTVKLESSELAPAGSPEATPALPAAPAAHFEGTANPGRAPVLAYPNNGALLPPNLGRLEVHFQPGAPQNTLFQIAFQSPTAEITYYTRCYSDPVEFESGACAFVLVGDAFERLAASNQGQGPVNLTVRGSDESGSFGESSQFGIEFAQQRIDGAVYYWTASTPPSIKRFDFGSGQSVPETFLAAPDIPTNTGTCVGCHALSRDGGKALFSLGGPYESQLVYLNDLSRSVSDSAFFSYNGAARDKPLPKEDQQNRVVLASFSPDGSEFVAVAPIDDPANADQRQLFFHDGTTGERTGAITLPFIPTQPDWSPLGNLIAVTAVQRSNASGITFLGGGIALVRRDDSGQWDVNTAVNLVPLVDGKNRFNPSFLPDGGLLLYSEVDQSTYSGGEATACDVAIATDTGVCNGYADPGAKTWAIAPEPNANPVFLAHAAEPGVADAVTPPVQANVGPGALMDTYPKAAPFETVHRGAPLAWFTVGSQRRAGLRRAYPNPSEVGDPATQALLWMFALEPDRVQAGEDGSHAGFFLPFQDLRTSNHLAQWTARIVSDNPPPPAPVPPTAPPPPAPPPPPLR
jgi:hypothetical protein